MSETKQTNPIDDLRAAVNRILDSLDSASPIAATVVFKVKSDKENTFVKNADALTEATRKLQGCDIFAYHKLRPTQTGGGRGGGAPEYLIYENWQSVKLFRSQWNGTHLKQFQYKVVDLVAEIPDLKWYYGWSDTSAGGRIPKTGQKQCWDTAGALIKCSHTGQDGDIQAGLPWPERRFNDNYDGTVTDRLTGLIWLQDADRFGEVTWEQALANARTLASGSGGLDDGSKPGTWRLPNIREFYSLIDYGTGSPIIPADHPFINVKESIYWTNTTLMAAPTLAWMMTLGIGPTVFDLKINANRMWPVRGESRVPKTGQTQCWDQHGTPIKDCAGTRQDGDLQTGVPWPNPRFTDNNDGTVTDNPTGLVWLKNANPFGLKTWDEALEACNNLASGSYGLKDKSKAGDWRLPNIREIESLVDYNLAGPCLPDGGKAFTDVRPSSYWSSTSVALAPTQAMFIILGVGPTIFENKEHPFFVWPVRDRRQAR